MKITKVKWSNHPILGNLELDFTNATGLPYTTILLAGENGTGKTTVLETISTFLNNGSFEYFEYINYTTNGQNLKAIPVTGTGIGRNNKAFYDITDGTNTVNMRTGNGTTFPEVDNNPINIRFGGCVISKARADFNTKPIKGTTTSKLDTSKYDLDKKNDFTSLKQLLVDLENQDNAAFVEINRQGNNQSYETFYPSSKIYRFKNAFDTFFDNLKYDKVIDNGNEKSILFKKNGKSIPIDNLSTGEKQIVFRGSFLLRNSGQLNSAAIFIDEPELSMHPKWQLKSLQYFEDLFQPIDERDAQLFLATHSEHILKSALLNKNRNLVIVMTEEEGIIKAKEIVAPRILPTITSAETNYLAFDIVSNDLHIELYGWLQDKTSNNTVKSCDDYIISQTPYNSTIHRKVSSFRSTSYESISTYIRNAIHHPDSGNTFTTQELRISIELLIELCT